MNNKAKEDISNEWIDASILFIDVVGFSKEDELKQKEIYEHLWKATKQELQAYQEHRNYISKSTGDGVLLIAFNPKINPLEIAKRLQKKLRDKDIYLRQGLNCGKVLPMHHRRDALGDPINICQRIMDCGDANHILSSSHYVAVKIGKRPPRENFHDFGEVTIKHGEKLRIFNYYDGECGNQEFPHDLLLLFPEIRSFLIEGNWSDFLRCCEIIDLSHELRSEPPCSYTSSPFNAISAEQTKGQAVGARFITTRLDNVYLNYGTHIDFPGHLFSDDESALKKKVSDYPLNRFITEAIVMDVSDKLENISPLIDRGGYINLEKLGYGEEVAENFFLIIESMKISLYEFQTQVKYQDIGGKAILFCTGLDKYWQYGQFEPWRYAYFFNPYISAELARFLVKEKASLIGIDALQIESPLINFGAKEPFSFISEKYRKIIKEKLEEIHQNFIHRIFLENEIMIVENLMHLTKIVGQKVLFVVAPLKLNCPGTTDNSITRAFALNLKGGGRSWQSYI